MKIGHKHGKHKYCKHKLCRLISKIKKRQCCHWQKIKQIDKEVVNLQTRVLALEIANQELTINNALALASAQAVNTGLQSSNNNLSSFTASYLCVNNIIQLTTENHTADIVPFFDFTDGSVELTANTYLNSVLMVEPFFEGIMFEYINPEMPAIEIAANGSLIKNWLRGRIVFGNMCPAGTSGTISFIEKQYPDFTVAINSSLQVSIAKTNISSILLEDMSAAFFNLTGLENGLYEISNQTDTDVIVESPGSSFIVFAGDIVIGPWLASAGTWDVKTVGSARPPPVFFTPGTFIFKQTRAPFAVSYSLTRNCNVNPRVFTTTLAYLFESETIIAANNNSILLNSNNSTAYTVSITDTNLPEGEAVFELSIDGGTTKSLTEGDMVPPFTTGKLMLIPPAVPNCNLEPAVQNRPNLRLTPT